jgi:tetraacyldisaccharide 4'-kinase
LKIRGIYLLYRVLQAFGLPFLILYFLFRGFGNRGYWRSLPQRFGFVPRFYRQTGPGAIWLHAVSVGEVLACVEFLRRLRAEFPQSRLFVSTSTLAGRATANDKLRDLADGIFYAPVDYVFAVRRVLRALRPAAVVIAETEIWPNLFREAHRSGAGLAIVNGRISDRAYPRYLPWRWFFRGTLSAADSILAQTDAMRERFLALGALPERTQTGGNFKYDFEARAAAAGSPVLALLERTRPGKVWIAASTMPPAVPRGRPGDVDEDDAVIAAFQELAARHPDLLLILAPRKPERFDTAAGKLEAAGIRFLRRSRLGGSDTLALPAVLLLDTIGELSGLFAVADAVFMGGTLAQRGGHNILEPAFFSKPVIAGPHMENFQAIADEFQTSGACVEIGDAGELAGAVARLLEAPELAREIGQRARLSAEARGGATARAVTLVRELYRVPRYRPAQPWFAVASVLARLWRWGARNKMRRDYARRRKLRGADAPVRAGPPGPALPAFEQADQGVGCVPGGPPHEDRRGLRQHQIGVPVISVGNITMGGTGKTPCVLLLAEVLNERGRKPGILTRGYGRNSPQKHLVLEPGAVVSAGHSGDEPQIFVRSGLAPVGIGADRFHTGTLLLRDFGADVLLLDDGFQHQRLARNVDVVLIDALDPFGGGQVFPLGRLREAPTGLARAHLILITRTDLSDLTAAIERQVRRWNGRAPIFRAGVEPQAWVEHRTDRRHHPAERPFERAGVFCGLGNPEGFRRTLQRMGVEPVHWVDFEDHHRYRPRELRHISQEMRARGATALVTTEKDVMNLCESCDDLLAPLPLYWLKVGMTIERQSEFVSEIERRL